MIFRLIELSYDKRKKRLHLYSGKLRLDMMSEPVVNLGKGLNEVSARQRCRKVNRDYHLKN